MKEPSREFYCPVTFGLLVQPHRTSCCKKQPLSELAVVRIKEERGKCPLCRASQWETEIDEEFQHKVQALGVFCAHVDRGCQWKGMVQEFDTHIASCPMKNAPLVQKQTGYIPPSQSWVNYYNCFFVGLHWREQSCMMLLKGER